MDQEIIIEDYSEKSFVVRGETRKIANQLKELSGLYNSKLRCGPGWIFSKNKREEVEKKILSNKPNEENKSDNKQFESNIDIISSINNRLTKIEEMLEKLLNTKTKNEMKNESNSDEYISDEEIVVKKRLLRK